MKTFYASTAGEWRSWLAQNSGIGEGSRAIEHACQGGGGSFGMVVVEAARRSCWSIDSALRVRQHVVVAGL
jgi:hypothetical protein